MVIMIKKHLIVQMQLLQIPFAQKTKAFTINVTDGSDKYVLDLLLIYHDDTIDDSSLNGYNADYDTASELLAFAQGQLETNQNARFTNSGITNLEFNVVGVHEWDVTYSDVEDEN